MTHQNSSDIVVENARQLLSTIDCPSMINQRALNDAKNSLNEAVVQLERLLEELKDESLEEHQRQIIKASIVMVKEIITHRTREVNRRMLGS